MKLKLGIIASIIFIGTALYFFIINRDPIEVVVYTALDGKTPKESDTPKIAEFIDWYLPMMSDAPPQVVNIMKRFDAKYRAKGAYRNRALEEFYPADEYIQRLLAKGVQINTYDDYSDYLEDRWYLYRAANNPDAMKGLKERHGLGDNATFDSLVDAEINENVLFKQLLDQAMKNDPRVYGGDIDADGLFIPYRTKTVYVQQGEITSGHGVPRWVPHELSSRVSGLQPSRRIPEDIEVIFLDDAGKPVEEKIAQSRAQAFQLEPYLKGAAHVKPVNPSDTQSIDQNTSIGNDSDIVLETQTDASDMPNRSRPDTDFNIDEIPNESALDASLEPKLPTDIPSESDFEKDLNDAEHMLDEPESEDDLRWRIETQPEEMRERNKRRDD